jgi:hypothetical protein
VLAAEPPARRGGPAGPGRPGHRDGRPARALGHHERAGEGLGALRRQLDGHRRRVGGGSSRYRGAEAGHPPRSPRRGVGDLHGPHRTRRRQRPAGREDPGRAQRHRRRLDHQRRQDVDDHGPRRRLGAAADAQRPGRRPLPRLHDVHDADEYAGDHSGSRVDHEHRALQRHLLRRRRGERRVGARRGGRGLEDARRHARLRARAGQHAGGGPAAAPLRRMGGHDRRHRGPGRPRPDGPSCHRQRGGEAPHPTHGLEGRSGRAAGDRRLDRQGLRHRGVPARGPVVPGGGWPRRVAGPPPARGGGRGLDRPRCASLGTADPPGWNERDQPQQHRRAPPRPAPRPLAQRATRHEEPP